MRRRLISLKTAILLPIVTLFIVTMVVQFVLLQRGLANLADVETHQTLRHLSASTRARLDAFLQAPRQALATTRLAIERSAASGQEVATLTSPLRQAYLSLDVARSSPQIHVLGYGAANGDYIGLRQAGGAAAEPDLVLRDALAGRPGHPASGPPAGPRPVARADADARQRAWFQAAAQAPHAVWSAVYLTDDERPQPALALAMATRRGQELVGVTSAELTLAGLNAHLRRQTDQSGGVVVLVDRLGRLIAQSEGADTAAASPTVQPAELLALSSHALPLLQALAPYASAEVGDSGATFDFLHGGERYFGRAEPYVTAEGLDWRILAVLPESTLLGDMRKTQVSGLIVGSLMGVFGLILTIWVVSMVTQPLLKAATAATQSSLTDLRGLRSAETPVRETALLMRAISDMAIRLQSSIDRLRDIALVDEHTQLPTRQGLVEMVNWEPPKPCALFVVGIDDFRSINNIMGYDTGDLVLRSVAMRLQALLPTPLLIARTGGDEFCVLHETGQGSLEWQALGANLLTIFHEVFEINREGLTVSGCVGAMTGELSRDNLPVWLRNAGVALREAKLSQSSACVHFSSDLLRDGVMRGRLIADLRQAVERQEFRVHYQPIVDLNSGQLEGAEALVRWQHPDRGLLSPAAFVAIAEESDLIVRIGEFVLKQVCLDSRRHWQRTGQWLGIHVNVSSRQLLQFDYQDLLAAELRRAQMPPQALTVELTESTFIGHDDSRVSAIFAGLKATGVQVAVDDFGTGYSSLSYLERLPLDCIKIDRSFIVKLTDADERGAAVAAAVIEVGIRLGLKLVAEGVETAEQASRLRQLGCKLAQGYLFARPGPWDDMVQATERAA